jgi:hypothetical protein
VVTIRPARHGLYFVECIRIPCNNKKNEKNVYVQLNLPSMLYSTAVGISINDVLLYSNKPKSLKHLLCGDKGIDLIGASVELERKRASHFLHCLCCVECSHRAECTGRIARRGACWVATSNPNLRVRAWALWHASTVEKEHPSLAPYAHG